MQNIRYSLSLYFLFIILFICLLISSAWAVDRTLLPLPNSNEIAMLTTALKNSIKNDAYLEQIPISRVFEFSEEEANQPCVLCSEKIVNKALREEAWKARNRHFENLIYNHFKATKPTLVQLEIDAIKIVPMKSERTF